MVKINRKMHRRTRKEKKIKSNQIKKKLIKQYKMKSNKTSIINNNDVCNNMQNHNET